MVLGLHDHADPRSALSEGVRGIKNGNYSELPKSFPFHLALNEYFYLYLINGISKQGANIPEILPALDLNNVLKQPTRCKAY